MEQIRLKESKNGSELLLETLASLGIDTIFGYPGGAVLPLYDAIYNFDGIRHILVRHEQGVLHEAEGYTKSAEKLGVTIATSGPDATNTTAGIADGMSDSIPVLILIGQAGMPGTGKDTSQKADIIGITMPITRYNYQIRDAVDMPRIITGTVHIAAIERTDPVVINLPKDASEAKASFYHGPTVSPPNCQSTVEPNVLQVKKILTQLKKAKRPLIIAGGGVSYVEVSQELIAFAKCYDVSVVSTLLSLGAISIDHPSSLGMGGTHGSCVSSMALIQCDFMINSGCRFMDRLTGDPKTFTKRAVVVHVDIDPTEIGEVVKTQIPAVGGARYALEIFLEVGEVKTRYDDWAEPAPANGAGVPFNYGFDEMIIKLQHAIAATGKITSGDVIIATNVDQHQMWVARFYPYKDTCQLITSGGLGIMRFGILAAIDAKLANPDKEVIVFAGDGGFQVINQELASLNGYGVPIKVVLTNNHSLGMVHQWQKSFYDRHRSESTFDDEPDFQLIAEAYGIAYYKFTNPNTLEEDSKVITKNKSMLAEAAISNREYVHPMVSAGKSNGEILRVKLNA